MFKKLILLSILVLSSLTLSAQKGKNARSFDENSATFEISTNLYDWADLGTINLDFGMSLARHFSLTAGVKYNGWEFVPKKGEILLVKDQQKTASVGVRYWPWYVFSGLWIGAKVQYSDFSETGVWRQAYENGKALGAGLSAGYTLMLSPHFNIEIGAGFWGGHMFEHNLYHCPSESCMRYPRETGPTNFIDLNDLNLSIHYLF